MRKKHFAIIAAGLTAGCSSSPSQPILGAFFPGWLLCLGGGLVFTLILRAVLIKGGRGGRLGPPILVWPLITAIITLILWIIFFQN